MSYRFFRDVSAECLTCGKKWTGGNAQGVAAIHSRKHGHEVSVDIDMHITYGAKEDKK